MKRYGNLWDKICDRENIELAATNALSGKKMTLKMRQFADNRKAMLDELEQSLREETYRFGKFKSFVVYEPKERVIHHPDFYPDKVLHHCVMNVVAPLFKEKFTADTYGSIKGRGINMAAEKLKKALADNSDWYFLKIDAKKFYESIDHDVIKEKVRRVIKCPKTLRLLDAIIDAHSPGMAIGVWPSQYLANLMLSGVDHWAKEVVHVKYYYRYMDDIVMLVPDKQTAHRMLALVRDEFDKIKLTIKNNVRIAPVAYGIDFIGYVFYPTHTRLRKRIKERMQRTVRRLVKQEVPDDVFKLKTASHFGWCTHANCRNLLRTTFKDKIYLYEKNMEFKRLKEIRDAENWFGLAKEKRVSIESLYNVDVVIFEHLITTIKNETKAVVKFAFADNPEDYRYFITRSDVIRDRLERDKDVMPFVVTIKKIKNYTAYE